MAAESIPIAQLKLVESAIYNLEHIQRKISRKNAHFLYALLAEKSQVLIEATAPFLADEKPKVSIHDVVHAVLRAELERRYDQIFANFPTSEGKRLSKLDRTAMGTNNSALTYGEVTLDALAESMYKHVQLPPSMCKPGAGNGGVFVDLGSGTGRGVFAALMLHPFATAIGIEILPSLHEAALRTKADFVQALYQNPDFLPQVPSPRRAGGDRHEVMDAALNGLSIHDEPVPNIQLHCGDFLSMDWSHADVVFANSTCFDDPLMKQLAVLGRGLKKGAYFLTLSKPLETPDFHQVGYALHKMSWGQATIYVHQKLTEPNADSDASLPSAASSSSSSQSNPTDE